MHDDTPDDRCVLPLLVCERLCDELARSEDAQALHHIETARESLLGPGLLTVNKVADRPGPASPDFQLQRVWTSSPVDYPVGGRKRKPPTAWTEHLLVRGEAFVGEGKDALAAAFDDSARILALGLRSVVNVPVLTGMDCVATFNVLGSRTCWRREEVAAIRLLAALSTPSILRMIARRAFDS